MIVEFTSGKLACAPLDFAIMFSQVVQCTFYDCIRLDHRISVGVLSVLLLSPFAIALGRLFRYRLNQLLF